MFVAPKCGAQYIRNRTVFYDPLDVIHSPYTRIFTNFSEKFD